MNEEENPTEDITQQDINKDPRIKRRINAQYALAICYFLIAILIIVASFAIPGINTASMAVFAILGGFLFIASLVQIFAVPMLACKPPPEMEE